MVEVLELRYVDLQTLVRWDTNPKRHDMGALAASIARHGFRDPPTYDATLNGGAGGIVEGNGRADVLSAMHAAGQPVPRGIRAEGGAWFVPVLFGVDAPSQAAAEAYGVAHNNISMAGGDFTAFDMARQWEPAGYAALLKGLAAAGELPVTVDGDDLDALLRELNAPLAAGDGGDDFDTTPDGGPTRCQLGDLWVIGGVHRLLVGDCTDAANVARLMQGERADMAFIDPPYGIGYNSNYEGLDGAPNPHAALANDDTVNTDLIALLPACVGGPIYLCTRWDVAPQWVAALGLMGLRVKNQIVWVKSNHGMGDLKGSYGSKWEAILFAHDGSFTFPNERPIDIWELGQIFTSGHRNHPTEKTIKVPEKAILDSTRRGSLIVDLFYGSGTTLIAAHRTGRRCYGMELAPKYCDVILRRAEAEGLTCERLDDDTLPFGPADQDGDE